MSRDKQIEEMAFALENHTCMSEFQAKIASNTLYILGYRKASEVAREIFEEIEKIEMHNVTLPYRLYLAFAKIKEKYLGEDTNVLTNTEEA